MLLALSSHGDNNINEDDSNNESNINMPSDDALFREFSSTSGDDNSDDEVTLKIAQVNDNIVGSQTIGNNTVPTIGTQKLLTEVAVKNGATVVLGGLITERVTKGKNGVIGLRRIPILGNLFGTTQNQTTREELLIFIQPRIVRSEDPLDTPNNIESGRTKLYNEAMQFSSPELENIPRALPAR